MAAVSDQPQQVDLREPGGWRRTKNRIMTGLMVLAFVIVMIPLGFVLFTVIAKGACDHQLAVPDQRHHPAERRARGHGRHGRRGRRHARDHRPSPR